MGGRACPVRGHTVLDHQLQWTAFPADPRPHNFLHTCEYKKQVVLRYKSHYCTKTDRPTDLPTDHVRCEIGDSQWGREAVEQGSWGTYGVGSHYQTTNEDTADWEDVVHVVRNCSVCEWAICKHSVNPIRIQTLSIVTPSRDSMILVMIGHVIAEVNDCRLINTKSSPYGTHGGCDTGQSILVFICQLFHQFSTLVYH
jgi:hypothetical protein